jgi:hypothetical protein
MWHTTFYLENLNRTIGKLRWRCECIKISYKERKQKGVVWTQLDQSKNQYIAPVYITTHLPSEFTKGEERLK